MWVMPPQKTAEDIFAEKEAEYPHKVVLGSDGPNPKLIAGNMAMDLIYIKRGDTKVYAFRTEKEAQRFRAAYVGRA